MIRTDHGSPFDRGAADSHYGRAHAPHKGGGGRRGGPLVVGVALTEAECWQYYAGYEYNEKFGSKKETQ